jgi:predicted nucleic acid-binding protein
MFVDEEGSGLVRASVAEAELAATSMMTYVETRAALARRRHAGGLTPAEHRRVLEDLEGHWGRYARLELAEDMLIDAARLAEVHRLRAYDAVHLASAVLLARRPGGETLFVSWDDQLDAAAAREGLRLVRRRRR